MDCTLANLDDAMRKKYQKKIFVLLRKYKNSLYDPERDNRINLLSKKLDENKIKRTNCLEKNKQKYLNENEFAINMHTLEYTGYQLELEIALSQRDLDIKKGYFNRLKYLNLILKFPKDQDKIVSKNKIYYLQTIFVSFLESILEEMREQLLLEQKIFQLYILMNTYYEIPKNAKYYISQEIKDNLVEQLIIIRENVSRLEKNKEQIRNIEYKNLDLNELLNQDINLVYNYILGENNFIVFKNRKI